MAWAKARLTQARASNFGLAQDFVRPQPPKAKPKPAKLGQARPCTTLLTIWASGKWHAVNKKVFNCRKSLSR